VARHPFRDVDLLETVLGLPPQLSFDRGHDRWLLRSALAGKLTDAVRLRRGKTFFTAMVVDEMVREPRLPDLVAAPRELGAYLDVARLRRRFEQGPDADPGGRWAWAAHIWRAATAELWLRDRQGTTSTTFLALEAG
jgi:hypothetical protein